MATKQSTEIKELKNFIGDRFNDLKQELAEVKGEIKQLNTKVESVDKRLVAVETKVDSTEKRLSTLEGKLPDISEKFGELKNWRQIALLIIAAVISLFVGRATKF